MCSYSQSAADTALAFSATRQVNERTAKPSRFLIQVVYLENPRIMVAKTLKIRISDRQ